MNTGYAMGPPRVSVVVPCYNSGEFLREAVDSALAQTYINLDVVVIDDGSTDYMTLNQLDSVSKLDRVRVIRQDHRGLSEARNSGIRATEAEFILPLDSDDLIDPPYVAEAVSVLRANPEVGMVYCNADFIGSMQGNWNLADFSWRTILVHNSIFCCMLYRRADWARTGGYSSVFTHGRGDHDFVLSLLGLGLSPFRLKGRYFHYRQSATNDSMNDHFGRSREALIEASAHLLRRHPNLYTEHADDFFAFIFDLHDQINDLRNRYALFEKLRKRFPNTVKQIRYPFRARARKRAC